MRSKMCSHAFRILCIHFACASVCQAAAGDVEQFPDTLADGATTLYISTKERLATSGASSVLKDEDSADGIPDNIPAILNGEKLKLFSAARLSMPDKPVSPVAAKATDNESTDEQNTRPSNPPLSLKRQGPLDWQSADASSSPQPFAARPALQSAVSEWEITPGDRTLNTAISRWATAAGWQLVWELPIDYTVETRSLISGSFEEAVETVAKSMVSAEVPIKAIFYAQNKVLRIVANGAKQ